uniref:Uncharacterized protein n=1 Tax=viral metagenome TaxID=1070528 RepID=A0A6M3JV20_9ZZZZ
MDVYFLEIIPKEFEPKDQHSIVVLNPTVAWTMQLFYGSYRFITPDQLVYPEEIQIEIVKGNIEKYYGKNYIFFQTVADINRAEVYWRQFLIVYLRAIYEYQFKASAQRAVCNDPYDEEIKFYYYCSFPPMYPVFNKVIREWIFERKNKCL